MASPLLRLLFTSLLVSSALALPEPNYSFSYNADKNVSGVSEYGWGYRKVEEYPWTNSVSFNGINYMSHSVHKDNNDLIVGSCYTNTESYPYAFIAHFDSAADWNIGISQNDTFATSPGTATATGFMGAHFLRIDETAPNGTVVASQSLRNSLIPSADTGLSWQSIYDRTNTNSALKYAILATLTTGLSDSNLRVTLTCAVSPLAGILAEGDTKVGPTALPTILQITNWPYQSPSNYLTLYIGVATGANFLSSKGISLITQSGIDLVYFAASKRYSSDGVEQDAKVSFLMNSTFDAYNPINKGSLTQVYAKYAAKTTFQTAAIQFAPGGTRVGNPMEDPQSFASKSAAFTLVTFVVLISLF